MPNITMCSSLNCQMKNQCYRSTARPDADQSWSNFEYSCNEDSGFDRYIKDDRSKE